MIIIITKSAGKYSSYNIASAVWKTIWDFTNVYVFSGFDEIHPCIVKKEWGVITYVALTSLLFEMNDV